MGAEWRPLCRKSKGKKIMVLIAFIVAFVIILALLIAHHVGYIQALKDMDKDIDKIFWHTLNEWREDHDC